MLKPFIKKFKDWWNGNDIVPDHPHVPFIPTIGKLMEILGRRFLVGIGVLILVGAIISIVIAVGVSK